MAPTSVEALRDWQRSMVARFRRAGLPLDVPPDDLVGWLHVAIGADSLESARRLVEAGADVNADHDRGDGQSCLESAASIGRFAIVEFLVATGADVNHVGKKGSALTCAARERRLDVYGLLETLTNDDQRRVAARRVSEARRSPEEQERATRFAEASVRGLMPTFKRLLVQGVDAEGRTSFGDGQTPLCLAAANGAGGRFPTASNKVIRSGVFVEMVEILLAYGADPNRESYTGRTPLMRVNHARICRRLLDAGADPTAVEDRGRCVLDFVKDDECRRMIEASS